MTENNLISNNNEVIINKSNKIKKFIKKLYELVDVSLLFFLLFILLNTHFDFDF